MRFQGLYYLLTGLWPIIHLASFDAVTGPKTDDWLVRMVGLLAAVIGATLLVAARRGNRGIEIFAWRLGAHWPSRRWTWFTRCKVAYPRSTWQMQW